MPYSFFLNNLVPYKKKQQTFVILLSEYSNYSLINSFFQNLNQSNFIIIFDVNRLPILTEIYFYTFT